MLNPSSDDHQWMQFYHQMDSQGYQASDVAHPGESDHFFDPTTDPGNKPDQKLSASISPASGSSPRLSPRPARRRPRASKRTPARVLNANTNNFRALVQQYTGCPSTAISFKGPVNLNFSNCQPQDGAGTNSSSLYNSTSTSSSTPASASASSYYGQQESLLPQITDLHRGSSFFPVDNFAATSSAGGFFSEQSSMDLQTSVNFGGGFAVMDGNPSVHGLPTRPDSFSW